MSVLVVIVNWRTAGLTVDCLRSLAPEIAAVGGTRVVVTDNASGDDSVQQISAAIKANGWSSWASVTPLDRNGGFAFGNNAAIRAALSDTQNAPDLFWLLNPDTIVLEGALSELVRFMADHPRAGVAGGRAVNPDNTVRRSAFRFHSAWSELEGALRLGVVSKALQRHVVAPPPPEEATAVDWVSGASMMARRCVFEQVGLLDDRYFMYFEETDLCRRVNAAGWEVWYVPQSRIIHLVGQSSGVTGAQRAAKRRPKYWFDSRRRYFLTHHGWAGMLAADLAWAGCFIIGNTLRVLRRRPRTDPPWLWWDFVRYNFLTCGRGT